MHTSGATHTRTQGYKGIAAHIALILLGYFSYRALLPYTDMKAGLVLPLPGLIAAAVLLYAERRALRNILSIEMNQMSPAQSRHWKWFSSTWYFWLLMLMAVIWRTYFRCVWVAHPLLDELFDATLPGLDRSNGWFRAPYWILTILLGIRELLLVKDILYPPAHRVSIVGEWASRSVSLLVSVLLLTGFAVMVQNMGYFRPGHWEDIRQHFLLVLILFTFFYLPLRWVEFIADLVDCKTPLQTVSLWLSMLLLLAGILVGWG